MKNKWQTGINWALLAATLLFQLGFLTAFYFFTWKAFFLFIILYFLTGIGVTLGFHRLITHDSFKTYKPIYYLFALLGELSAQGSAIWWAANHRMHHAFSDKEGDPHTPNDGFIWSHMIWFLPNHSEQERIHKYAPDLIRDPILLFLHDKFIYIITLSAFLIYLLGLIFWDHFTGLSFLAWGFLFRTFFLLHATWFVNSASHKWGYRNYTTTDKSTNLWWVALLTWGEGWHNNHHKFPRCASHGHKWWEIDITYFIIKLMEKLGLAWDIIELDQFHKNNL